jgi:hypothetical protein
MRKKKTKPSTIDHEAVHAVFLANGGDWKKTSEATGVKLNTLYVIAKRNSWTTPGNARRKIIEGRKELATLQPEIVTSSSDGIAKSIEKDKETFHAGLSSGLSRAASFIGSMTGEEVLAGSREIKNVVDSARVIYNLGGDTSSASVSINLLNMDASMLAGQMKVVSTE